MGEDECPEPPQEGDLTIPRVERLNGAQGYRKPEPKQKATQASGSRPTSDRGKLS
jgi:hypothetical protein